MHPGMFQKKLIPLLILEYETRFLTLDLLMRPGRFQSRKHPKIQKTTISVIELRLIVEIDRILLASISRKELGRLYNQIAQRFQVCRNHCRDVFIAKAEKNFFPSTSCASQKSVIYEKLDYQKKNFVVLKGCACVAEVLQLF